MKQLLAIAFLLGMTSALPQIPKADVCGYDSCPKPQPGKINVHLVPHTHDDVGWIKTVDQYYYGSRNELQNAGIQYIFDSVVTALLKNPDRKFIFVEIAFFWKWWVEQTPEVQDQVKMLVNQGRLEFIGGGWSMNDEAATHYQPTVDQFTYSLRKLNETFGVCGQPKIGWQIDPFGHAREQASLMAQFGFDGFFFARLDYQDKNNRVNTKTMEMVWETNPTLGDNVDMFTHALYNHYSTPGGFCFDDNCGDDPIIDNPDIPDYNVPDKVNSFIDFVHQQQSHYLSDNIIVLFGDDFQYKSALKNYRNIDKLIRYVNERQSEGSDVNVFYSTPSCYLKAVNDANLSWPTKQDDFFPYASDPNSYWAGYFTSRPTLKYFERQSNNILQAGKQLAVNAKVDGSNLENLQAAMGVVQHHDAITGTEWLAVAKDYTRLLDIGVVDTEEIIFSGLNKLLANGQNVPPLSFDSCRLRNISQCTTSAEKDSFLVTVYNPLGQSVDYYVRLPVSDATYTVLGPDGSEILTQTLPVADQLIGLPGRDATTTKELVFKAEVPPAGYSTYLVSKSSSKRFHSVSKVTKIEGNEEVKIGDEEFSITLDPESKFLKSISTKAETYDVAQSLQYYIGSSSGAYQFFPTTTEPFNITDEANTTVIQGDVVHEVHQVFSPWASQIIRHYNNQSVVEFEWLVDLTPAENDKGKEVISKFTTTIPTNGLFYTDSNGRQVLERKRDYRPTWDLEVNEPVSGNYYPIVTSLSFHNDTSGLAIVTDRAQGGASLVDGSLEIMVNRYIDEEDHLGQIVRGRHFVLIGQTNSTVSPREIRLLENRKVIDSLVYLSDATGKTFDDISSTYRLQYTALKSALPPQVHLLTLEPWQDGTVLLRLEHLFTREEDSTTVQIDLTNILAGYEVTGARETNLAANKWIEETERLSWKKEANEIPRYSPEPKVPLAIDAVQLQPKQIRTFVLNVNPTK